MAITFNQFLARIDEAYPTWGSSPRRDRPTGQLPPRSSTRGRTGPELDWKASETKPKGSTPPKPSGGITFDSRSSNRRVVTKPTPEKVELGLKKLGGNTSKPYLPFNRRMQKVFVPTSNSGIELTGAAKKSMIQKLRAQKNN